MRSILQAMSVLSRLPIGALVCSPEGFMRMATPSPCQLLAQVACKTSNTIYLRHAIDIEVGEDSVSKGSRGRGQSRKKHRLGLHGIGFFFFDSWFVRQKTVYLVVVTLDPELSGLVARTQGKE
jgi:hypothetical protein